MLVKEEFFVQNMSNCRVPKHLVLGSVCIKGEVIPFGKIELIFPKI